MKEVNRNTILTEMRDMAWHNVLCYSKNYAMDEPKDGMREKWETAKAEAEIIDQMYDELPTPHYDEQHKCQRYTRKFTGTISGWGCPARKEGQPDYVDTVEFAIDGIGGGVTDGDTRIFHIDQECGEFLLSGKYDIERHERYDEGKNSLMQITVDSIGYIRKMEWVEK